jgi:hypothetical protein
VRVHPILVSAGIAIGSAILAFLVAIALDAAGLGRVATSGAAAAVVAAAYALRPVDGLLGFGLLLLFTGTVAYWTGVDVRYGDEIGVVLLIGTALVVHRHRLAVPRPGWREAALGVFLGAGIVSSLLHGVPADIWIPGLALLAKTFVFLYLVMSVRVNPDEVRRMSVVALAVALVVLAIGAVEVVAPEFAAGVLGVFPFDRQRGAIAVVNSWFTHPALYGWLAAFVSLFLLARFAVLRRAWTLVLGVLVGGALVLSGRRTPAISVLISLAVGVLHQVVGRRASWRAWAAIGAGAVLVVALSVPVMGEFYGRTFRQYFGRPARIVEVLEDNPRIWMINTLHPRVALYAGSIAIARDEMPLGVGIGRFGSHMSRAEYSPVYAEYKLHRIFGLRARRPIAVTDTFWPMVLGETGVVGLLGAIGFFALLTRDLWRAALIEVSPEATAFTLGALMVFVEALTRSVAAPVFVAPPIAYWVFGAAGLALALRAGARQDSDAAPS